METICRAFHFSKCPGVPIDWKKSAGALLRGKYLFTFGFFLLPKRKKGKEGCLNIL